MMVEAKVCKFTDLSVKYIGFCQNLHFFFTPVPTSTQDVLAITLVLSILIRGITITLTGDWQSGQLAALSPSIMLPNSLLTEGIIQHISLR